MTGYPSRWLDDRPQAAALGTSKRVSTESRIQGAVWVVALPTSELVEVWCENLESDSPRDINRPNRARNPKGARAGAADWISRSLRRREHSCGGRSDSGFDGHRQFRCVPVPCELSPGMFVSRIARTHRRRVDWAKYLERLSLCKESGIDSMADVRRIARTVGRFPCGGGVPLEVLAAFWRYTEGRDEG